MLSSLPSLAPRDSYALWYTSSHLVSSNTLRPEISPNPVDGFGANPAIGQNHQRRAQQNATQRSPLARLRADELYLERRKHNVSNYGSSWLKPPGVHQSLHQQREAQRELEEHQEAMRREALAQELAEAEDGGDLLQGEGMDGEMEAERDLDDDIPDANATGMDAEGSEEDSEGEDDEEDTIARGVMAQRMPEDVYREAIIRGDEAGRFGDVGGSEAGDQDLSQMLEEDDLLHEYSQVNEDLGMGMDMDADLDDGVPDADPDEYEHTDTEEELTSSDEEDNVDAVRLPNPRTLATSMVRSDGTQNSLDLSAIDLRSGSSFISSSPRTGGIPSPGRSRRTRPS